LCVLCGCSAVLFFSTSVRADERHAMRGVVLKVDAAGRTMFVSIEKVPGYMDAMVMPFAVRDAAALTGLKPGATIEFRFVVDGGLCTPLDDEPRLALPHRSDRGNQTRRRSSRRGVLEG